MRTPRIAIVGFGLVSPCGFGLPAFADGLLSGHSMLKPTHRFKLSGHQAPLAGEVPGLADENYHALGVRFLRSALEEACVSARCRGYIDGAAPAVLVSTTIAGGQLGAEGLEELEWPRDVSLAEVGLSVNTYRSVHVKVTAACASSAVAFAVARDLLLVGQAEEAIVFSSEVLNPFDWMSLERARATSKTRSRPFDRDRDGLSPAEGAGVALLATTDLCARRNIRPLAWLDGAAVRVGGADLVGVDTPTMERCMSHAATATGILPDYIHAHATGTRRGDSAEAQAIANVFGPARTENIPVSSHKGAIGHGLRVSGFFGVATALVTLQRQMIPPSTGMLIPDPECPVCHVQEPLSWSVDHVLVNNFGFGGNYASLLISRAE